MMTRFVRPFLIALCCAAASVAIPGRTVGAQVPAYPSAAAEPTSQWLQDLSLWRAQRERAVSAPDGWLTLAGLNWLKPGVNSIGAVPGSAVPLPAGSPGRLGLLTVAGKTIQLLAPAGGFPPGLTIDGKPAREGPLVASGPHPSVVAWHSLSLIVLARADRYMVRIKNGQAPALAAFHGLNWYPPAPRFLIAARWTPYNPPHIEKIPTGIGTTLNLPAPGVAEFTLDGKTLRLEPVLEDPTGRTLFFILSDSTSSTTTYQTARYLHTGLPDHGLSDPGLLTLDFNRLENPPCAYTPYANCPQPPDQNRLDVPLEAGEKRYAP